jgi:hypothetical protein
MCSFANAEISKNHVQDILHVDSAKQLAQSPARQPKLFRHDFLSSVLGGALRVTQCDNGFR